MVQKAEPESTRADFGANEWLVDELYEQYLQDKNAVDPAWWDFFEGYRSGDGNGAERPGATAVTAPGPAQPAAPAPSAAAAP
ncbi:2-oxoglutarate dehydrogenase E1 subunit family protein, partial [Cellulomonas massiliensis]|uniref:2-oxoglutarate dehydrogenase E1 subunit family protein n=1 Tax=Cellulomonas massiliensis TaxID=1465811 RepID=UPI000475393A